MQIKGNIMSLVPCVMQLRVWLMFVTSNFAVDRCLTEISIFWGFMGKKSFVSMHIALLQVF